MSMPSNWSEIEKEFDKEFNVKKLNDGFNMIIEQGMPGELII